MFDELQSWSLDVSADTQAAFQAAGLVLVALLGGHVLGLITARALRARNFDATLRVPGSSPPPADADRGITPTLVAGWLVRLTVWALAVWWLAQKHGRVAFADTLWVIIS